MTGPAAGANGTGGPQGGPAELRARLGRTGYLVDEGLAIACLLALRLHRPLFCEADAGVGRTALADVLGAPLIRLQCYEGIDASQALHDWDLPRRLLHLRAAEAAGITEADRLESELYSRRFLIAHPLLQAVETRPSVLLVDEVDRADDEFEAFLLELLSEYTVTVPEPGTLRAQSTPVVVLTSNRTGEVHDALKRRCLCHWFYHPGFDRELTIVRGRQPQVSARLAAQVTAVVQRLRTENLLKPPGVDGTIDWAEALDALGATELEAAPAFATLGSVLKHREDAERARCLGLSAVLAARGVRPVPTAPAIDATAVAVGLTRALRAAGVATGPDRTQMFLGALDLLNPARRSDVYGAGRLTLCGSQDDLERYDRVFAACFDRDPRPRPPTRPATRPKPQPRAVATGSGMPCGPDGTNDDRTPPTAAPASSAETLRTYLDRWGQRSCARGAVVVVLSDGWERADPALPAARMRRLHRLAHRVVWANPRKAQPGYVPLAAGMAAALPHVDAFVEGHSSAALEHLAAVVRGVASDA
ncbi:VWA domain-containing protein [Streptomyces sp. NPDC059832]|uniref:VWA domain-containing protein n=1 Tax=Streptomyces sp. NPDC059832 TaxID=3346966 RepID=UPI0036563338